MRGLLIRWLILTAAILAAAHLLDGIVVSGLPAAIFAALILGILNALFRPILLILTLPLNILTLGLFTFVINALLLMMVSGVLGGFEVQGFWPAFIGALIISVISWGLTSLISDEGRFQTIELRKRRFGRWE
jgi:putative membrane protein